MDLITLAQKRWGQIPAIVLVDGAGLGPSGHLRASSTVTYLEKPFSPSALHNCITTLIGLAPLPEEPPLAAPHAKTPLTPEPSVAEPSDVEPALAEPSDVELVLAEPSDVEPALAEPSDVEPALAEPSDVEPVLAEPSAVEPSDAEPALAEPSAVEPSDVEPALAEPSAVEPSDVEPSDAEPSRAEPVLAEQEDDSEPQLAEDQAHTTAFQSAETLLLRERQEDLEDRDPSLSSVTPLPVSRPPSHEISDIWLQQPISANEPSEPTASTDDALALHNEGVLQKGEWAMALTATNIKENLTKLESIDGFVGAALADSDNGMCLGFIGGGGIFNLEIAAAANTEVVRSKRKAIKTLSLRDEIEDILITLGKQYHLIRPVRTRPSLFYYLALDRQRANLAMARYALAEVERELPL